MKNARRSGHGLARSSLHLVAQRRLVTRVAMDHALHVLRVVLDDLLHRVNRVRRHDDRSRRLGEGAGRDKTGNEDGEQLFHGDSSVFVDMKPLGSKGQHSTARRAAG